MRYIIGLDVGIGSVGWAAIQYDEPRKILDFGVRAFDSGENKKKKASNCQIRRGHRGVRRLERRRRFRKDEVKRILEQIGLTTTQDINRFYSGQGNRPESQPILLRVKALDEQLSPEEIAACLIHMCNRRGYRDYYELDDAEMSESERAEYMAERAGAETVDRLMASGEYRTIAEMIISAHEFNGDGNYRAYRNRQFTASKIQINRTYLVRECRVILKKQQEYYPIITDETIDELVAVIFRQRCFEDGPGRPDDPYRKYKGFLDTYGQCQYVPGETRACRFTVLADMYSLVNKLSQFKYFMEDGTEILPEPLAVELLDFALTTGDISVRDVTSIAKKHGISVLTAGAKKNESLGSCLKFTRVMKRIYDEYGLDWDEAISEDYRDMNSLLNRIGVCMEYNQTPSRRVAALRQFPELREDVIARISVQKLSGTSKVCEKYMAGAIDAFLAGERYGEYQARVIKENASQDVAGQVKHKKLPPFESDKESFEFYKNRVVCRAINEARKVVNALVERYGSPYAINIEVSRELGNSFKERDKISYNNRMNEKARAEIKEAIASLLNIDESAVTARQIECYRLGELQDWKCMYSGEPIDKRVCLDPKNRTYEIDHIVPYSLVLDNTLHNKVLVLTSENRIKGQRTPLMYMSAEQAEGFKKRVRIWYNDKKKKGRISDRKYAYLTQPTLYSEIIDEWKSRNINDTRYISKFLVRYFKENLEFDHSCDEPYRRTEVYAVKAAITSQLRRLWLNEKTWGRWNKDELKNVTLLDHAVDAVVIACCIPAYVELASVQNRLSRIYRAAGKIETDEYRETLKSCLKTMKTFYGIPESVSLPLLRRSDRTPCLIQNLREEVDIRFIEPITFRYFGDDKQKAMTDDEICVLHAVKCCELYRNDPDFARNIRPVVVSHKPRQLSTGSVTKENVLAITEIGGNESQVVRIPIASLTKKQLSSLRTDDTRLIHQLTELLSSFKDNDTVQRALKESGQDRFVDYNGRTVNRVTVLKTPRGKHYVQRISDTNYAVHDVTNYYCLELYRTNKGNIGMHGITYSDLRKINGKLFFTNSYTYPDDYSEHIMYLFKWDYIVINDKDGNQKFAGYYVSCAGMKQRRVYFAYPTTAADTDTMSMGFSQKDTVRKYSVDILGRMGGEISSDIPLNVLPAV